MSAESRRINTTRIADSVWSAGPGRMLTVWVQGCNRRCPGCINSDFLDYRVRSLLTVEAIAARLRPEHDGICFSGGEPFLQAEALTELAHLVRRTGRSVVSYSGFTLAEIESGVVPGGKEFLAALDILIDGPFEAALAAPIPWRGSRNQRVHFLTPRHGPEVLSRAVTNDLALTADSARTVGTGGAVVHALLAGLQDSGWKIGNAEARQAPTVGGATQLHRHINQ